MLVLAAAKTNFHPTRILTTESSLKKIKQYSLALIFNKCSSYSPKKIIQAPLAGTKLCKSTNAYEEVMPNILRCTSLFFLNPISRQMHTYFFLYKKNMHKMVLPPFQIVGRLTFSTLSLTTRFIQKFVQNITSFVVACFIYKFLKNGLNLTMFAYVF